VPVPHDLDGTWCKVIGARLGSWLYSHDSSRALSSAVACNTIMLTCGGFDETPTCAFMDLIDCTNAQVPPSGLQPLSRQSFGTFKRDAGLQVRRKL
jgi:hypothetical protein